MARRDDKFFRPLFWLIICASGVLYCILNPQYHIGAYNDDAAYVLAAQGMWGSQTLPEQSLIHSTPDFPFPGLPLVLSPLVKLVDPHWALMDWVSVAVSVLGVFLLGFWMRQWMAPGEALVVMALYAFNPIVAKFSGILMPAPFFIAAILTSFFLLHAMLLRPSPVKAWLLGLVLAWGSLTRPEGILLLASVLAALALVRRWKDLLQVLGVPILAWSIFAFQWVREGSAAHSEYGQDLDGLLSWWPKHLSQVIPFSGKMLQTLMADTLAGLRMPKGPWTFSAEACVTAVCAALTVIGFRSLWRQRLVPRGMLLAMAFFSAAYFAIHVFWHVAIPRYCVALLPFVFVLLSRGLTSSLASSRSRRMLTGAVVSVFVISYAVRNGFAIHQSLWEPDPLKSPPWQSLSWFAGHTPPSAQALSTIAPSVMLYARRVSISLMPAANGEDFVYSLMKKHLDYVVDRKATALSSGVLESDDPNKTWDRFRRWMRLYPQRFPLIYTEPVEKVAIYRVAPEPGFTNAYEKYVAAVRDLQSGREADAVQALHESVGLFPRLGSAHNALGFIALSHGNSKDAEREFRKTVEFLPDSPMSLLNLASLYYHLGRQDESLRCLAEGLKVSAASDDREEFVRRVRIMQARGEIAPPPNFPTINS